MAGITDVSNIDLSSVNPKTMGGDPSQPFGHMGLLDHIIYGLTGSPDAALAPEDMADRSKRRAKAGQMAANAANGDLGDSFMQAPSSGGSGFGINDIISLVSKVI